MDAFVSKVLSNPKLLAALKNNEDFFKELKPDLNVVKEKVGPETIFKRTPRKNATSIHCSNYDAELDAIA